MYFFSNTKDMFHMHFSFSLREHRIVYVVLANVNAKLCSTPGRWCHTEELAISACWKSQRWHHWLGVARGAWKFQSSLSTSNLKKSDWGNKSLGTATQARLQELQRATSLKILTHIHESLWNDVFLAAESGCIWAHNSRTELFSPLDRVVSSKCVFSSKQPPWE